MSDLGELEQDAKDQIQGHEITCCPSAVLALIADFKVSKNVCRSLTETLESVCESRDALDRAVEHLKAENEALRKALAGILDLYDTDEGCRNLPQYIVGRAALGKGEQS